MDMWIWRDFQGFYNIYVRFEPYMHHVELIFFHHDANIPGYKDVRGVSLVVGVI